jgi:hypothetical protein
LGEQFVNGTDLTAGYYDFDENGILSRANGVIGNRFYLNGVPQNAYQLILFEGNYYFISDGNLVAKNCTLYLGEKFVENTDLTVGYYDFDENGVLSRANGVIGNRFYLDGVPQNAYQVILFEGNYYFISDNNLIAKDCTVYLSAKFVEGTPLTEGYYSFDADGKIILP